MYNRLYKYLLNSSSLYKKHSRILNPHSTDHAILQLVDQIHNNFEQNYFTLGVFIDLSKAFDTVDHNILLKEIEINGIVGKNLKWFKNYLNNRNQYIQVKNKEKTNLLYLPLLFLICISDLQVVSDVSEPIIFADDTNLFYSHKDITALFFKVNNELHKVNQ